MTAALAVLIFALKVLGVVALFAAMTLVALAGVSMALHDRPLTSLCQRLHYDHASLLGGIAMPAGKPLLIGYRAPDGDRREYEAYFVEFPRNGLGRGVNLSEAVGKLLLGSGRVAGVEVQLVMERGGTAAG